jgi:aspartyl/glutamyl-tRNA(Asn/Gln) amidotransferase C subunit
VQSLSLYELRANRSLLTEANCFSVKDLLPKETKVDTISQERLQKLCELSRIEIDADRKNLFQKDVSGIMHFLEVIRSANFGDEKVEPMYSPVQNINLLNRVRKDEVTEGEDAESILRNAKNKKAGLFLVPGRDIRGE